MASVLPHASERLPDWLAGWERTGRIVVLLDFDGTLAPIVERPEQARPLPAAIEAIQRLQEHGGAEIALISGRGLSDARTLAGIQGIAYAGNHGLEIEGPGIHELHAAAAAARPHLEQVAAEIEDALEAVEGAFVEDKGLTLSVHFRQTPRERIPEVRRAVEHAVADVEELRLTEGKMVLEIRPRVEWDKGRAVEFLLQHLDAPPGTPVVYIGDDTTDEDAFRALARWAGGSGEGVIVTAEDDVPTAARSRLRNPEEVAALLAELAAEESAPPALER